MVLSFNYLPGHDAVNIAVYNGSLDDSNSLGDCIERVESVPPGGNRIGFFMDIQVPEGSSKSEVIHKLQKELTAFSGYLKEAFVAKAHATNGLYTAQDLTIKVDFQADFGRTADFYISCFQRIIESISNTTFINLKEKNTNENRLKLKQIGIKGYKSIASTGQHIDFGDITILLGANGSGKSNLVSFFKLLNFITSKGLQVFIGKQGGADALLYYGSKHTDKLEFSIKLEQVDGKDIRETTYGAKLVHGMPDRLFFATEKVTYQKPIERRPQELFIEAGNSESGLPDDRRITSKVLFSALAGIRAYQFHDTSDTAKIKLTGYIDDSRYLRSDAGNLAAFLLSMLDIQDNQKYYDRIIRHIQKVMPQFKEFDLETIPKKEKKLRDTYIKLNWRDTFGDTLFGPHQISDGSLRFIALSALLLQPPAMLPQTIIIDEPELGLHPAAIAELAGMIKTASKSAQIIIATQSTRLVDEFSADNIVIVERDETSHSSIFKRLNEGDLKDWLSRYSLSELWEKNVLGGRP
jgi:predicted ATPase